MHENNPYCKQIHKRRRKFWCFNKGLFLTKNVLKSLRRSNSFAINNGIVNLVNITKRDKSVYKKSKNNLNDGIFFHKFKYILNCRCYTLQSLSSCLINILDDIFKRLYASDIIYKVISSFNPVLAS